MHRWITLPECMLEALQKIWKFLFGCWHGRLSRVQRARKRNVEQLSFRCSFPGARKKRDRQIVNKTSNRWKHSTRRRVHEVENSGRARSDLPQIDPCRRRIWLFDFPRVDSRNLRGAEWTHTRQLHLGPLGCDGNSVWSENRKIVPTVFLCGALGSAACMLELLGFVIPATPVHRNCCGHRRDPRCCHD